MSRLPETRTLILPLLALSLLLLAFGYWGAWLPHPAAALTILGIDLPEYVKFVPEVSSGQIPIRREVFFYPLIALLVTLILLATGRQPRLPLWLRGLLLALAVPAALAMLPPAWTPALLRQPEFRTQTLYILLALLAVLLSPLLHRYLPDTARGALYALASLLTIPALRAFPRLLPALEKIYARPLEPGVAYYLTVTGAVCLFVAGVVCLASSRRPHVG